MRELYVTAFCFNLAVSKFILYAAKSMNAVWAELCSWLSSYNKEVSKFGCKNQKNAIN